MGHFLVNNQGIKAYLEYELDDTQEIDTLCMGMLKNNKIQGILPVTFQQVDKKRYFKYSISSKITLDKLLEGEVNRQKFLTIITTILKALMESEDYMIPYAACLMEENKIYVDSYTGEAYLICLPVLDRTEGTDIRIFLKNILFQAKYDNREDNSYVAGLIGILNQTEHFSIAAFQKEVELLLRNKGKIKEEQNKKQDRKMSLSKQSMEKKAQEFVPEFRQDLMQETIKEDLRKENTLHAGQRGFERQTEEKNKKKKLFGGLFQKKSQKYFHDNSNNNAQEPVFDFLMPGQEEPIHSKSKLEELYAAPIVKPFVEDIEIPADFGGTTLLSNAEYDETTVLQQWEADRKTEPYLIRNNTQEKFHINKTVIRIGREQQLVDYCVRNNKAIGRSHADIITRGQGYYIIDLNSKNGTYINGKIISAQQETEIFDGDHLRLANEEFIFHT